ncbi:hypothetical protein N658DRAFT_494586 [Parathielavia hyrcaniae]|uniref:Uncharacterized protein n=1 Tax=Parathielavia hyrcaniae TaxID=113614 RepID=A0AAN6Q9N5_9PEZI|nr:hypothetical protein N658DRAFT_494586 [Parathielavia hyrcaniae]
MAAEATFDLQRHATSVWALAQQRERLHRRAAGARALPARVQGSPRLRAVPPPPQQSPKTTTPSLLAALLAAAGAAALPPRDPCPRAPERRGPPGPRACSPCPRSTDGQDVTSSSATARRGPGREPLAPRPRGRSAC